MRTIVSSPKKMAPVCPRVFLYTKSVFHPFAIKNELLWCHAVPYSAFFSTNTKIFSIICAWFLWDKVSLFSSQNVKLCFSFEARTLQSYSSTDLSKANSYLLASPFALICSLLSIALKPSLCLVTSRFTDTYESHCITWLLQMDPECLLCVWAYIPC